MTNAEQRWLDSEKEFTAQCLTAERLKKINPVPNSANLDPIYVKATANWLIHNDKKERAATNAAAKAATAKAATNKAATNKAATNKAAANAAAKAAAAKAATNAAAAKAAAIPVAKAYTSSSSSLEQNIQKISNKLQAAKKLLTNMSKPKSGGSTRKVMRR